jgi:hypothetical protein
MVLREIGWNDENWIVLTLNKGHMRALVVMVMNLRVP